MILYGTTNDLSEALDLLAEDIRSGPALNFRNIDIPYGGHMMVGDKIYGGLGGGNKVGWKIRFSLTAFSA